MSHPPPELSELADWESTGLKLLKFTHYYARVSYGWAPGKELPGGKSPQDVVLDVYRAYVTRQRAIKDGVPIVKQMKEAIRSVLWNLHKAKDHKLRVALAPEEFEVHSGVGNLSRETADDDYREAFWRVIFDDAQVKRSTQLADFARAIQGGAESVDELTRATGLTVAQIYELRRRLKPIALRVVTALNEEGASHEPTRR